MIRVAFVIVALAGTAFAEPRDPAPAEAWFAKAKRGAAAAVDAYVHVAACPTVHRVRASDAAGRRALQRCVRELTRSVAMTWETEYTDEVPLNDDERAALPPRTHDVFLAAVIPLDDSGVAVTVALAPHGVVRRVWMFEVSGTN